MTTYASSDPGDGTRRVTVTDAASQPTNYTFNLASQRMTAMTDALGHTTSWQYDSYGRLTLTTAPEGNYTQVTYDARGNVIQQRAVSKTPGTPADIVTSAVYPSSCSNTATCNEPTSTTDARGAVTNYAYDPTHGGVTSVTAPAAPNGIQPQTRYSYTSLTDSATGQAMYRLTGTSACRTTASCAGTADETKTTIGYETGNLLPISKSTGAGDGSLTASTTASYDAIGNVVAVDGPLAGAGDTSRFSYDAARQLTAAMGPDPDGAGAAKPPAMHYTYNADGQVTFAERGAVPSQATDWTGFVASEVVQSAYDTYGRKTSDTLVGGGAAQSLTQYGYDGLGRLQCTAQRMNPAVYSSLPIACTLGSAEGVGNDRIALTGYDVLSRVTSVTSGYNTPEASTEAKTYTPNGKVASVKDGELNLTQYGYDGFDRLVTTSYPLPTQGSQAANAGDYEQYTPDANSNVTSRRLRDGKIINYGYDALDRLTQVSFANPVDITDANVTLTYDLTGNLLQAIDANQHQVNRTYDALGRVTSERGAIAIEHGVGATTFGYDAAGRMTRQTWPDGVAVGYDYRVTGDMSTIRDGAGNVLASFGYDDLGRRANLSRANGTVTSYAYDPVSRLSQLTQDLAGTGSDLTVGFGYNPAGQITSRASSNDAYAWTGHYNVDRPYTVNGLNQLTAAGATPLGYDGRGNLTTSAGMSYTYNSKNQLSNTTGPTATTIYYDPLGLIDQIWATGTEFDNALGRVSTEWVNGSVARRYVYGPGSDEPLIWYEGAGLSDRRWLHADERGSVVAVTNDAGNTLAINSYDEYGIPAAGNLGRFQYTGQKWLPELGMYDYKARIYSPTLGRFLQTDPIGYGDGTNWYNYVGGDPVNNTDPSGSWDWHVTGPGGGGGGWNFGGLNLFPGLTFGSPSMGRPTDEDGNDLLITARLKKKQRPAPTSGLPQKPNVQCVNADGTVSNSPTGSSVPGFGSIWAIGGGVIAAAGLGGGVEKGTWYDLATGQHGGFVTTYYALGTPGGGVSGAVTTSADLGTFSGWSTGGSVAGAVFGGGAARSDSGGWTYNGSAGFRTPQGTAYRSFTRITSGLPPC